MGRRLTAWSLLLRYPPMPLGKSEKNKEKARDVGVLCIKVRSEKEKERGKKTKSIHPHNQEWMYRNWKCTLSAITPSYHDPSLSNGFTVTNVPSVRHLRAITMVHYCMCNLRYGIYSFLLLSHMHMHWEHIKRYTPTQQSFDRGQEPRGSKTADVHRASYASGVMVELKATENTGAFTYYNKYCMLQETKWAQVTVKHCGLPSLNCRLNLI